ncbi:MAG: heme-binding protein [Alphaproteobacteria bacterium]|nr:heme-binding protein [Alphaproteobacteria bacterium]MDE2501135.1 heme-binding protein [Alphaproteobacteria bacterium]
MHGAQELGEDEAGLALEVIIGELKRRKKAGVIAVADRHGELLALWRMDGAPLSSVTIATNKAFTAAREKKPSGEVGRSSREGGWDISYLGDRRYVGWDGGVPVTIGGAVAGAVAVSGLSGEEDVELATLAAKKIEEKAGR